jgi:hypothetical protein
MSEAIPKTAAQQVLQAALDAANQARDGLRHNPVQLQALIHGLHLAVVRAQETLREAKKEANS